MKSFEIKLPNPTATRLREAADKLDVTVEELLRISVEEKLARLDQDFSNAAQYVLDKNRDLYKRLA